MLSLQNAKSSRNRILAVPCAVIILLCGALLMISPMSMANVGAQDQSASTKFRRVGKPIPNQYIVVLNDDVEGQEVLPISAALARGHGGTFGHVYRYALKGFSIHGVGEVAAITISQDPRVEFVEEDGEATVATTQTNPPLVVVARFQRPFHRVESGQSLISFQPAPRDLKRPPVGTFLANV